MKPRGIFGWAGWITAGVALAGLGLTFWAKGSDEAVFRSQLRQTVIEATKLRVDFAAHQIENDRTRDAMLDELRDMNTTLCWVTRHMLKGEDVPLPPNCIKRKGEP